MNGEEEKRGHQRDVGWFRDEAGRRGGPIFTGLMGGRTLKMHEPG